MRKIAFLTFTFAFAFASSQAYAFSIKDWEASVYTAIKDATIKGLQANFHVPGLSIGKTSGPIIGQISFGDVVIPGFARAQKITVNYNLIKFLYLRDIVPAISGIKIEGAVFDVKRSADNHLNVLSLLLPYVPGGPPPPVFTSKLYFKDCRINYVDALKPLSQSFGKVAGQVSFAKKDKISINLTGQADGSAKITGVVDFKKGRCDFIIAAEKVRFYDQLFSGKTQLSFHGNQLEFDFTDLNLYRGQANGKCVINFAGKEPQLTLNSQLKAIDLAALAQNSPGITGLANGSLGLSGPFHNLSGKISAQLSRGALLGQPIDLISSAFTVTNGGILFKDFSATSKTASVGASGSISSTLVFDFKASARGIRLAGHGFPGPMEALVEDFTGNVNWKLDDKFFTSPLKNIRAAGSAHLSQGKIGEQTFDRVFGDFSMGDGVLNLEKVLFENKTSSFEASGQIGFGVSTTLTLSANKIKLEDFKILNYLLPEEAKNPAGTADISLNVTGELSKEAKITSIEPLLGLNASGEVFLLNGRFAGIPIKNGNVIFSWENRRLKISSLSLVTPRSNFSLKLSLGDRLDGNCKGIIDLSEFSAFTEKYGNLDGQVGLNFLIRGNPSTPDILADFWINNLQFNRIKFSRIEGKLDYADGQLVFPTPLLLQNGTDRYFLSGKIDLADKPAESSVDMALSTTQSDLPAFVTLALRLQAEISRRATVDYGQKIVLDTNAFILPHPRDFNFLYSLGQEKNSFINLKKRKEKRSLFEEIDTLPLDVEGKLSLDLSLKGKINNPSGQFSGEIKKGSVQKFYFDNLKTKGQIKTQKVIIDNLSAFQKSGQLTASGEVGFDGSLALKSAGKDIDIAGVRYNKVSADIENSPHGFFIHDL
ncbi:MAG: hypothetical protein WCT39_03125, partial [Candidatus Margulisiibacteriota bacterium]